MAGAIVGGVTSGIEAYSEGERGADLAMDVVGGMLFRATIGATVALGGAAGLSAVAGSAVIGSASISIGSAIAISVGGMAIGSATKYSLDCALVLENGLFPDISLKCYKEASKGWLHLDYLI